MKMFNIKKLFCHTRTYISYEQVIVISRTVYVSPCCVLFVCFEGARRKHTSIKELYGKASFSLPRRLS